jgi:hypothetical protein
MVVYCRQVAVGGSGDFPYADRVVASLCKQGFGYVEETFFWEVVLLFSAHGFTPFLLQTFVSNDRFNVKEFFCNEPQSVFLLYADDEELQSSLSGTDQGAIQLKVLRFLKDLDGIGQRMQIEDFRCAGGGWLYWKLIFKSVL